jgi:hypothetical protein
MSPFGILILTAFLAVALVRLVMTVRLIQVFLRKHPERIPVEEWPMVVAVMALRGGDEFLKETLARLTSMDYPNYILRLVIDSETDPSLKVVNDFLEVERPSHVEVCFLGERPMTCSGKVAGMLRGTQNLPSECSVVAVFDGDAVVQRSCLRQLVEPLMNGASLSTGNRWYAPPESSIGALTRFAWNGCALSIMNSVQIPWGGCMAMQRSVITDPELRRRLSLAFGEDSTIATFLLQRNLQIRFVPESTVVNQEDCSITGFYNFLVRQYLTVRLHNPRWNLVFGTNLAIGIVMIGGNIYFAMGYQRYLLPILAGYLIVLSEVIVELVAGTLLVRRQKSRDGLTLPPFRGIFWVMIPIALTLLNHMNPIACIHALLIRTHVWRGITYEFFGDPMVRIIAVNAPNGSSPPVTARSDPASSLSADLQQLC